MIDSMATRKAFVDSGRKVFAWARAKGFDPVRMRAIVYGRIKNMTPDERRELQRDGLLVEIKEAA